jgi:hypothetical protein
MFPFRSPPPEVLAQKQDAVQAIKPINPHTLSTRLGRIEGSTGAPGNL